MGTFFFAIVLQLLVPATLNASTTSLTLRNGDTAILIGKDDGRLKMVKRENNSYNDIEEFFISYGQNNGSKAKKGDNKTPEGIYFATGIKTKHDLRSDLPEDIYGTYAVPLNYPNPIDEKKGNSGYGIWLHGTDSEEKLSGKNITKGCIIMENTNISQLVKHLRVMNTPVIVSSSLKDIKLEKNDTDRTYILFKSASENYKVTILAAEGLEKKPKVLYEEMK
jgi:murein L,D-transpeptidase YafK